MSKFKVGDKVLRIKNATKLIQIGEICTIKDFIDKDNYMLILKEKEHITSIAFNSSHFKLANSTMIKDKLGVK